MTGTLNLAPIDPRLDAYHRRFLDEGFPPELSTEAFERFDRSAYADEDLVVGRGSWALRALDEVRSLHAFSELLAELAQVRAPFDVIGVAVRIVRDEARHVELCRRMVRALGGDDRMPGEPRWVRSDPALPLRARVIRTVVASLCIGETLSVAMLSAVREQTRDPLANAVMTCLVADESIHSRFGWLLLEHMLREMSQEEREGLGTWIPELVARLERTLISDRSIDLTGPRVDPPTPSPFGSMDRRSRGDVYRHALAEDVLRRFDALSIRIQTP